MSAPAPAAAWRDRVFLALALASLALKLALALYAAGSLPVLDEGAYWRRAELLAQGKPWESTFRPPLYVFFLAGVQELGGSFDAVRVVQALLATATLLPVYGIGRRLGGRPTARLATAFVAFDPVLNGFAHLLWSETLYLVLFLPAVLLLLRDAGGRRPGVWLAAGLLLGGAALTRPQLVTFAPFVALWAIWQTGGEARRWLPASAMLALGMALVVLPWTARNYLETGAFVLIDTNGPYNLLVATEPEARFVDKDDRWDSRWGRVDERTYLQASSDDPGGVQRKALTLATRRIAHDPVGFAKKSAWEVAHFFTLDDFVARHLRNGFYHRETPAWAPGAYALIAAAFTALLFAAGLVGVVARPPSPFRAFVALAFLHALLLYGACYSLSRYSVPLRPLLALSAAWLLTHRAAALARLRERRWAAATAGLVLVVLLGAWSRDVPLLADMVRSGGAHHRIEQLP